MTYFLVLLLSAMLIILTVFCSLLTFSASSEKLLSLSNIGCINSTAILNSIRQTGNMNRLIKYVATLKRASKAVKYIKFFIEDILSKNNKKSRGEVKWV